MAVFSNLEGTMKKTFVLGKNGARLEFTANSLKVQNYTGTGLIPISAADPLDGTHLVTLSYFNAHSGGGSGNALRGTVDPDPSLGIDGDVYYKIDDTNILQIYIKDSGIWKPFLAAPTDSEYVTTTVATPSDFQLVGSDYVYTLPASTHNRGANIIVQLQDVNGATLNGDVVVDGSGNITVTLDAEPTEDIHVVIVGGTTLSTPYSQLINKANWVVAGSAYTLTIPQSTHEQVPGALFISVYQNTVDGATSAAPFSIIALQTAIDSSGNITLTTNETFSGKLVISGK